MQNLKVFIVLRQIITYIDLQVSKVLVYKSVLKESVKSSSKRRAGVLLLRIVFYDCSFYCGFFIGAGGKHLVDSNMTVHWSYSEVGISGVNGNKIVNIIKQI